MAMQRLPQVVAYIQEFKEPGRFSFPGEFSGITHVVSFRYHYELSGALDYLKYEAMRNDHVHNIAVAFDGNKIYTTRLGASCITKYVENGLRAAVEHVTD
jgi:hypothetical protein